MSSLSTPYQHFLSDPIAKPPCRMHIATMYGFFAEIELAKSQRYIDSTLNVGVKGNIRFKILGEFALPFYVQMDFDQLATTKI
ncbi:MAG: hypothetical protein ACPHWY_06280 [Pseudoalteromonas tetraodonis]|jgi:hypothetical protein